MNPDTPLDSFIVSADEAGSRLDLILVSHYQRQQSRHYFQSLINEGYVQVNGQQEKKQYRPAEGERVDVRFVYDETLTVEPEDIPLEILYEDSYLIAVNKPAGMVVHPAVGNWTGTFANALMHHCKGQLDASETVRPGIVHRLDKDTSGVLIAAKDRHTQGLLSDQFAARQVTKEYCAICRGNPPEGTIDLPIGRHPVNRKQMCVRDDGRPAITHIRRVASNEQLAVVSIGLETGRTHQIRVHLRHVGTPIVGDAVYGSSKGAKRQQLHAYRLLLTHPVTGAPLDIRAPLPEDMMGLWNQVCPELNPEDVL